MKVQTAFRLDEELITRIKEKTKVQKRSLNNHVEYLLYRDVGNIPNEETKKAIYEGENDINLTPIDDLEAYLNTLIHEEEE